MKRVLRETVEAPGDGLLKRALELRHTAEQGPATLVTDPALPMNRDNKVQVDAEKKKPSLRFSKIAA